MESRNRSQALVQHLAWGYTPVNLKAWEERKHAGGRADVFKYDPLKRLIEAGFDAPDPQSKQFAKLETYRLDRVDNLPWRPETFT